MDDISLYQACECFKTDINAEQDLIRLKILEHLILVCSVCKCAIYELNYSIYYIFKPSV